jgi:hypothetical protein
MDNPKPLKNPYALHRRDSDDRHYVTILTVDPVRHTATVLDTNNRVQTVPILRESGPDGEGDFGTPMPGWKGILTNALGFDALHHCFPPPRYFSEGRAPETDDYARTINTWLSLTNSLTPYSKVQHAAGENRRAHRPYDLLAGDWGVRTSEGASVYALRGGVAGMKVGDLCQLMLNQVDDLTRLVSRNVDVFTDWGHIQIINDEGKTRLKLRANARAGDTYSDRFAYELTIGDTGGPDFLRAELRETDGVSPAMIVRIDRKGNRFASLAGDEVVQVDGHQGLSVARNQKVIIGGNQDKEVDGTALEHVGIKKTIHTPSLNLGAENNTNEPAVLGAKLTRYLQRVVQFINYELVLIHPFTGPTLPGAANFGLGLVNLDDVPDFLSDNVTVSEHYEEQEPGSEPGGDGLIPV